MCRKETTHSLCGWQVAKDIEELNRLCQLTTRPHVIQLLQQEAEKLQQSNISSVKPVDGGPEQVSSDIENSCADAAAASTETSSQHSSTAKTDSATATNYCIAVTRSASQRYYKEITTYGEIVDIFCLQIRILYYCKLHLVKLQTCLDFHYSVDFYLSAVCRCKVLFSMFTFVGLQEGHGPCSLPLSFCSGTSEERKSRGQLS